MSHQHDHQYLSLVRDILENGVPKSDRTGTGTLSVFSREMRFNLHDNIIPLITTKKIHVRSIIHELLWYLRGDSNVKYLQENGVRIWNEWADENGDLGPVYGQQFRRWPTYRVVGRQKRYPFNNNDTNYDLFYVEGDPIDQIANVIQTLQTDPNNRRMIVSAWNVAELENMALPPCHAFFQFYVAQNKLSCKLTQRSCDVGLGVPFNIAQYSILTLMIAHVTGFQPGEFIWSGGDVHIYNNHIKALTEQLTRTPFDSPTLWLNPKIQQVDDFQFEDIKIQNYESHPTLKMEVSV